MGDAESLQPSKKRAAVKELSRDNPGLDDDNESSEQENGTFKRASDEVMANRRIVKVRKAASTTTTPSSNPFAAIQLVPPANTSTTPAVTTTEAGNGTTSSKKPEDSNDQSEEIKKEETDVSKEADHEKESDENSKLPESKFESTADANVDKEKVDKPNEPNKPESTEKKAVGSEKIKDDTKTVTVVEKSADGIEVGGNKTEIEMEKHVGDGKNDKDAETASFSSFQQLSSSQNAFTGLAGTGFSNTTFSFGASSKEGSPLGFGSESGSSSVKKSEGTGFPSMQEVPVVTGEEHEKAIFTADSMLFEYLNGGWKERGKGELKLNISSGTGKARLVMRTRGNYRLILNANLYPEMKLASMDKKGVTFACMNSADDGKDGLSTIALKFKDASIVEEFRAAVTEHKDKIEVSLKTPPNSP
ncbi:nuclear pore complex protein NUP50A-like isoform X2 [Solanum tuberosum]|uniref:nuclear pore complex protein NUP50A-like isoform X2 n=1 Tax=Solanum tuberosum TaxID=4113 RepID=UPI00073A2CF8|nr:PREDICTED: nuclear pore complex protein NUP50A-like isoform X2 [Solanum tuberosum]